MKRVFTALFVCVGLLFAGCIDREFDLADTSGEITVGGEELVLPLADISKMTLADLIGDNDMLQTNEEGVYQISFSSFGEDPTKYEKVSIEGISIPNITGLSPKLDPVTFSFGELPTFLLLGAINEPIAIDLPVNIGEIMHIEPIQISKAVELEGIPSFLPTQGVINSQMLEILGENTTISKQGGEEAIFNATIEILKELERVDWVEFGCEEHPYGTPFNLVVNLAGLQDIVSEGLLKLNIKFPEGYYLRNADGSDFPAATHNIFNGEIPIVAKQKEAKLTLYLHKIDYSQHSFTNGKLDIDDHIQFSYELSVTIGAGSYNLNAKPTLTISAAPEYKDVEVKINHFEGPSIEHNLKHTFNGMPNGVSVEKIAFNEDSNLNISLKGLEWCVVNDNLTGDNISPKIEIDLPRCMHFREHSLLDESNNVLLASTVELAQGITLSLDHIDCKNSTGIKQENGQFVIDESIKASVHMESLDGHTVLVSTITPPEKLDVSLNVAESRLTIDTDNSVVTWSDDKLFDFNLTDNIPYLDHTVEVPEMISEVKLIEIGKANSDDPLSMNFKLDVGTSFPVEELDIDVAVNLGKLLRPTQQMLDNGVIAKNDNGDYLFIIKESWRPKEAPLAKILQFDALQNIPAIVDGKISIKQSFPVTGSVKIKSGENIDLSATTDAKVAIDFTIDDIEVRSFTGNIDLSMKPENMFVELNANELGGIDVNALSLNPVLTLRLKDNPTGVGLNADIAVSTFDKEGNKTATITVPTIPIAGNGGSTIVLSTPRNANKYSGNDITFIAVDDLSKLLSNGIPAKIAVDMEVSSNKNEEVTIDLKKAANGYEIEYQYEVLLPLEFDGDINLAYETKISDLNETFATLADSANGLKVGDVGLVAEFDTTIPFNIVLSAELINAEGTTEGIAARLNINDCVIKGYNKATDGEKKHSKIDLDFDLGESGSLEGLKNADGVKLKFAIYNTDAEVAALAASQFLEGKLKLRVRNGLTIDIFDFLTEEGE